MDGNATKRTCNNNNNNNSERIRDEIANTKLVGELSTTECPTSSVASSRILVGISRVHLSADTAGVSSTNGFRRCNVPACIIRRKNGRWRCRPPRSDVYRARQLAPTVDTIVGTIYARAWYFIFERAPPGGTRPHKITRVRAAATWRTSATNHGFDDNKLRVRVTFYGRR